MTRSPLRPGPPDIPIKTWNEGATYLQSTLPKEDPDCLWRFLVANNGNGPNAEGQYRATLQWRASYGVDTILDRLRPYESVRHIKSMYPHFMHGRDTSGRLIYVDQVGRAKAKELLKQFTEEDLMQYHTFLAEYMWTQQCPRHSDTMLVVLDLKGLSFSGVPWGLIKKQLAQDTLYLPERLGKLFIVNAPGFFTLIWKTISPWLDQRTKDKIEVVSKDFTQKLLRLVDMDQLPSEYGGRSPYPLGEHPFEKSFMEYSLSPATAPLSSSSLNAPDVFTTLPPARAASAQFSPPADIADEPTSAKSSVSSSTTETAQLQQQDQQEPQKPQPHPQQQQQQPQQHHYRQPLVTPLPELTVVTPIQDDLEAQEAAQRIEIDHADVHKGSVRTVSATTTAGESEDSDPEQPPPTVLSTSSTSSAGTVVFANTQVSKTPTSNISRVVPQPTSGQPSVMPATSFASHDGVMERSQSHPTRRSRRSLFSFVTAQHRNSPSTSSLSWTLSHGLPSMRSSSPQPKAAPNPPPTRGRKNEVPGTGQALHRKLAPVAMPARAPLRLPKFPVLDLTKDEGTLL